MINLDKDRSAARRKDVRRSTTFRLSEEARKLIEALARAKGVSRTAVLEIAVREFAKTEKVK